MLWHLRNTAEGSAKLAVQCGQQRECCGGNKKGEAACPLGFLWARLSLFSIRNKQTNKPPKDILMAMSLQDLCVMRSRQLFLQQRPSFIGKNSRVCPHHRKINFTEYH